MKKFLFFAITFEPIINKTCKAPLNDHQNLSFVKDKHICGEEMARKGPKEVIYKFNFISNRSLVS